MCISCRRKRRSLRGAKAEDLDTLKVYQEEPCCSFVSPFSLYGKRLLFLKYQFRVIVANLSFSLSYPLECYSFYYGYSIEVKVY